MKYLLSTKWLNPELVLAFHWQEGMDRLEWVSPYDGNREFLETCIEKGYVDRYVTAHDLASREENVSVTHVMCINTLEGLEVIKAWHLEKDPEVIISVTEIADD
jgi:hypothetical protein